MTTQTKSDAVGTQAFEQLMAGYYEAAGVAPKRKAGSKHRFIIDEVMVIATFVEHVDGPSVFLVAHFQVDMSRGHAGLLAAAMCNNFFMHALGVPTTWGINPITDQLVAMCRLPLPRLTPETLGAQLEHFIASAKQQLKEMTTSGLLLPSRLDGGAGGGMRSNLFAKVKPSPS